MYCTGCGKELAEGDLYCSRCGRSTGPAPAPPRRLVRPMNEKMIAGVCAGFARYFNVDVTIMRLIWVALAFFTAGGWLLAYPIAWIVMPSEYNSPPTQAPQQA